MRSCWRGWSSAASSSSTERLPAWPLPSSPLCSLAQYMPHTPLVCVCVSLIMRGGELLESGRHTQVRVTAASGLASARRGCRCRLRLLGGGGGQALRGRLLLLLRTSAKWVGLLGLSLALLLAALLHAAKRVVLRGRLAARSRLLSGLLQRQRGCGGSVNATRDVERVDAGRGRRGAGRAAGRARGCARGAGRVEGTAPLPAYPTAASTPSGCRARVAHTNQPQALTRAWAAAGRRAGRSGS